MRLSPIALLLLAAAAHAQPRADPAQFERILFPVAIRGEIPGAFGTRWSTFIVMFNDGNEPALFYGSECPSPCTDEVQTLAPRAFTFLRWDLPESLGRFLWVQRNARLAFAAILRDNARTEENSGTELPVVREPELDDRIVLPLVLTRGPFRVSLRIYGHDAAPVRVRMFRQDRLNPFVDEVVQLTGFGPAFFQTGDIVQHWPQLEAAASVRIELESETKIWAFASQTNNVTQLVTVIRPQ